MAHPWSDAPENGVNGSIEELLQSKRPDILALAEKRGARNVRVVGSVVRGESRPDSDLDLLVDLDPGRSLIDLGGLLMDLQGLLGLKVDVVAEAGWRPRLRQRVVAEAKPL